MIQPRFAADLKVVQDYRLSCFDQGPSAREYFERDRELQYDIFDLPDRLSLTLKNEPAEINGKRAWKGLNPEPAGEAVELQLNDGRGNIVASETVRRQVYVDGADPVKSGTLQPLAKGFWEEVLKTANRMLGENPA